MEVQKSGENLAIPLEDRNRLQKALIEELCAINKISDSGARNKCAIDWITKYADNMDDLVKLDWQLVNEYLTAIHAGQDGHPFLVQIQEELIRLDKEKG